MHYSCSSITFCRALSIQRLRLNIYTEHECRKYRYIYIVYHIQHKNTRIYFLVRIAHPSLKPLSLSPSLSISLSLAYLRWLGPVLVLEGGGGGAEVGSAGGGENRWAAASLRIGGGGLAAAPP